MLTTPKQMTNIHTHTQWRGYHHNLTIRFPLVTQNANHKPLLSDKASVHNLTMMQRDMISKQGATIERHSILLMYNEIRTGLRHVLDRRSSYIRSGWSYSGVAQKSRRDWASFVFTIRLRESESGAEWRAASEPQEPVDQDATARCEFASIGSLQQSEATPSCYMMSHSFVYSYVGRFWTAPTDQQTACVCFCFCLCYLQTHTLASHRIAPRGHFLPLHLALASRRATTICYKTFFAHHNLAI